MESLDFVDISTEDSSGRLTVDTGVYSIELIKRTALSFAEFCYVHMAMADATHVAVTLVPKRPNPEKSLIVELVGELANEMLNQALRDQLKKDTKGARELIVGRALYAAEGESDGFGDDLDFLDDDDDFLDDPLGIAVPWEDKSGDEAGDDASAQATNDEAS